jgi:exodeoxyribonuclease-5
VINKYLASQIKLNFPFHPTIEQENAIDKLSDYLLSGDDRKVFLLCGYAGTGKTSLISALVRTMEQLERKTILLAPTGRAAKVFTSYSGKSAHTIHKCIYRQKSIMENSVFTLSENRAQNTLFIVDEASMIDILLMEALLKAIKNGASGFSKNRPRKKTPRISTAK